MRTKLLFATAFLAGLLSTAGADAQQIMLERAVIANGGGMATNGTTTIHYTVGQPVVGVLSGGGITAYLGFWNFPFAMTPTGVEADAGAGSILALNVAPNPVTSRGNVGVRLATPGAVEISLYDPTGTRVRKLFQGERPSGDFTVSLDAEDLASGAYYIVVSAPGALLRRPVTVVR